MRCGECGSAITAEHKVNRFGSRYIYYHCTHKQLDSRCRQRVIRAEVLENEFVAFIEGLTVKPRMHALLLREIKGNGNDLKKERQARNSGLKQEEERLTKERAALTALRLRELIDDEEFATERRRIEAEQRRIAEARKATEDGAWIEPAQIVILGLERMVVWFRTGDAATKRQIINLVGSNPTLIDKKLICEAALPFLSAINISPCPNGSAVLDDIRTLWEQRDPRLLNMIDLFRKLLARDEEQSKRVDVI
jgi:hypothetical protein